MNSNGSLLKIEDLHTRVEGKEILKGVNLTIPQGETHVLFGPNGSGKSSLVMAVIGAPNHEIVKGKILFKGQDITHMPTHQRAALGIGVALQRPPTVKGVKLRQLLEVISAPRGFSEAEAQELRLSEHLDRDVNMGFSGGETKRAELLQLLAQRPNLVLLDEPESGVDLENMALVGRVMSKLLQRHIRPLNKREVSGLMITHTGYALDYVTAEKGHVLVDGTIVCSGNPREILHTIRTEGFEPCKHCFASEVRNVVREKRA